MSIKYKLKEIYWFIRDVVCNNTTAVKCRKLHKYGYVDKDVLMMHCMFEILSQFVEQEFNIVDWHDEEYSPKIKVNSEEKFVGDEILDLYKWYQQVPKGASLHETSENKNNQQKEITNRLFELNKSDSFLEWDFESEEDEQEFSEALKQHYKLEVEQLDESVNNMKRLCNIAPYMWT